MKTLLELAIQAAIEGGKKILEVYAQDFSVFTKEDNSPLTEADRQAHECIKALLTGTNLPLLSEEGKLIPYEERKHWETFWLVDPLDGTKEFIKRNGEFTVNIALIENGAPVLGVIYAPATDRLYYGVKDKGAFKREKGSDNRREVSKKADNWIAEGSRSHSAPE